MRELVNELLQHYDELRRHLTYKLRDSEHAADVAQTSFERVYSGVLAASPNSKSIESPRALLFRVAHNLCIDEARHRRVVASWEQSHIVTHDQFFAPSAEYLIAHKRLVEKVALQIELLPARRREVFLLFKAYGYTQTEIAQRLNITEMAVAKHVVRATLDCSRVFAALREEMPDASTYLENPNLRPALAEEYC